MLKTNIINGKIILKSGLHIGGNKDTLHIGGIDGPVIKNPVTNLPYIPGSSMKGKIRFLLEHYYDLVNVQDDGGIPGYNENNKIALIFGHLNHNDIETPTLPTRVIFNDAELIGALDTEGEIDTNIDRVRQRIICDFVEAKTEVVIDRISGTAKKGGLRTIERVPAGVVFDFSISLRVFKPDEEAEHIQIIKQGLKLLQNDALGGSGSRGSGRIEFKELKMNDSCFDLQSVNL